MYCFAMNIYTENTHFSVGRLLLRMIVRFNCAVCVGYAGQRNGNEQEKRTICRRHFEVRDKQTKNGFPKQRESAARITQVPEIIFIVFVRAMFKRIALYFAEVLLRFSILCQFIILINATLRDFKPHLFHFVSVYPNFQYFHSFYLLSLRKGNLYKVFVFTRSNR